MTHVVPTLQLGSLPSAATEVDKWTTRAINGKKISKIPSEYLPDVIERLKAERDSAENALDKERASAAQSALISTQELEAIKRKEHARRRRMSEYTDRLMRAQRDYEKFRIEADEAAKSIDSQFAEDKKTLEERQSRERELFEEEWQSPEKSRRYSHPSDRLLTLQDLERGLFKLHKYDEIDSIRKKIDEERRDAEEIASRKLEDEYTCAKQKLYEKQKTERDILDAGYVTKKNEFTSTRNEKELVFSRLVRNLEEKIDTSKDQDKVWNLYHRHDLLSQAPVMPQTARTPLVDLTVGNDTSRLRVRPPSEKLTRQPVSSRI